MLWKFAVEEQREWGTRRLQCSKPVRSESQKDFLLDILYLAQQARPADSG